MHLTQKRKFHHRRVSLEDLRKIENLLIQLLRRDRAENPSGEIIYILEQFFFENDEHRSIDHDDPENIEKTIEKQPFFEEKKLSRISLLYKGLNRTEFEVTIAEGEFRSLHHIEIKLSSSNEDLVYSTFERISTVVKGMEKAFKLQRGIDLLLSGVVSLFVYFAGNKFVHELVPSTLDSWSQTATNFAIGLLGVALGFMASRDLSKAFPSIEFSFGPADLRRHKRARSRLQFIWTAILVPLVVSTIYDAFK